MKILFSILTACVLTSVTLLAQGPLAPTAAPAPTMKTLSQVEGRTVIDPSVPGFTTPYTISQPGSYYLAGNINVSNGTSAIVIAASNVTVDLNGFALISTSSPFDGMGIQISGVSGIASNILIRNGSITGQIVLSGGSYSGAGFAYGIYNSAAAANLRVIEVAVSRCRYSGIYLEPISPASNCIIDRCTVDTVGSYGVSAGIVTTTTVVSAGDNAIDARICSDSYGASATGSRGIFAYIVKNSYGSCIGGIGIDGLVRATAADSYGTGVTGISVETVTNCSGIGTTGPGVRAQIATNSQGNSNSGIGLQADLLATNCRGTSASGNGLQSSVTANSFFGATSSVSAIGLKVTGTANVSGGQNTAGGVAIQASIGIGCGLYGGSSSIPAGGKFLGTP